MVIIPKEELETLMHQTFMKALAAERLLANQDEQHQEFVSKRQAAGLLGVCISTIGNLVRADQIKKHYVGKTLRFKRTEVLSLAQQTLPKRPRPNKK